MYILFDYWFTQNIDKKKIWNTYKIWALKKNKRNNFI